MSTVKFSCDGGIARISLNRPAKLNAITPAMLGQLEAALDRAEQDDGVRVVTLDGHGRVFSAGFDMSTPDAGNRRNSQLRQDLTRAFNLIMRFWDCPKPTIAAVHGYCLGSALEIAAVCDLTIAADDCVFGAPEVQYGSGIVCLVLPWIVGLKHANEIVLTGSKNTNAERAAAIGLVNRVVSARELCRETRTTALQIAANDALAVRLTKKAMHRSMEIAGMRQALKEALESDIEIETTDTPESDAFNDVLAKKGLRAALDWRAGHNTARKN